MVAIEAEHYTDNVGAWEEVEGRNATEQGRGLTHDFRLAMRAPDHPLAAGLRGVVELPRNTPIPWAMPGSAATIVAAAGHDPAKAVVFGYERGAELPGGGRAIARRAVTTAPLGEVDAFRRLFSSAMAWAAEGSAKRRALLVLNEEERAPDDLAIEARLVADGFEIERRLASDLTPDAARERVVVVPGSVRVEKLHGRLREVAAPIVLAHKTDIALDLGLTSEPRLVPGAPNAMMIRAGKWTDHLRYVIHFGEAGEYQLWLLGQSGGTGGSDEVKVFFEEAPNPRSERFFEMRFESRLGWTNRAFARRPENRKTPVAATVRVTKPGWHTLWLAKGSEPEHHTSEPPPEYRYPNWRVDKLVLHKVGLAAPEGDGPAETRNTGELAPPGELLRQSEFLPKQVWRLQDGVVAIEAEAIDHDPHWQEAVEPKGFTGAAFLEWRGPGLTRSVEGLFGNDDHRHVRQGAPEWGLIVRVFAAEPGTYRLDVRNHHRKKDGDNDCWIALVGARASPERPIVRLGDSHRDGTGFTWLDWGVPRLQLQPGLNEIRVGGRSVGFGVDRIVLYREGDEAAKARALNERQPPARPGYLLQAVRDFEVAPENAERATYYFDIRGSDRARHALAIDATRHRERFAAARANFAGIAGTYDLTLSTLTENDGESTYRVRVAGRLVGEARNPPRTDNSAATFVWRGVALQPGDLIEVESNTHSNGKIPEAGGFAWARGRWTSLGATPAGEARE